MFKNLFLLFKNINLSINILGCLIIKYLYNFSFGMQFSRYIEPSNLIKFSGDGDGEIRTLDPLLARQVLSQLSYTPINWHPPTLPYRLQYSTIGRLGLNHRVRNGNGCVP